HTSLARSGVLLCWTFEVVLLETNIELTACQAEAASREGLVPVNFLHDARNRRPFDRVQIAGRRSGGPGRGFQAKMLRGDQAALAEDRGALEHVVELAHVARPLVLQQGL